MFPDREATDRLVDERQCVPGRITPESIEPVYAWLCAAESDVISGQVICADQGFAHY